MDLDSITVLEDSSLFKVESMFPRAYEYDSFTVMAFTLEVNMDKIVITRSTYTFLDLLSDIGGI